MGRRLAQRQDAPEKSSLTSLSNETAVKVDQFPEMPVELSKDEISDIVTAFGEGARRAKAWGFDAVQLHAAHGFLINQFLSPLTNRRTDEYGGSMENRCRFLGEVYSKVREKVGTDYPVLIKLNAADHVDGGLETGHCTNGFNDP